MPEPRVSVVIPTLLAGATLVECVRSLEAQTRLDFEILIVDNSGDGRVKALGLAAEIIENPRNLGFGAAINQGWRRSRAEYIATINDDAVARPYWLEAFLEVMDHHPESGMGASRVLLAGRGALDSAGMLICADGSSKQRGHGEPPELYREVEEILFPSGSAAIYRRQMLDDTGGFDERFFLYCEDTDLGLRARWAGWKCLYIPSAVVEHRYSQSSGGASPVKAYYVERNRLFVVAKNFPVGELWRVPLAAMARYIWHVIWMVRGRGSAAEFRRQGNGGLRLVWFVIRAHAEALMSAFSLWNSRRDIRKRARISAAEFTDLLRRHSISPREVAAQ